MDNVAIHSAEDVRKLARNHKEDLIIIYQPQYLSELNPQESMWNWTKSDIAQSCAFKNGEKLLDKLEEFSIKANNHSEEIKNMVDARKLYNLDSIE